MPLTPWLRFVLVVSLSAVVFVPSFAWAFSFGGFLKSIFGVSATEVDAAAMIATASHNEITPEPFLDPANNENPREAIGGADFQYEGLNALVPIVGPLGNVADADEIKSYHITTYTVREGDSLSVIAKTFGVSIGTIFWANDLRSANLIRPGDVLVILPVSGAKYTVKKGDTIASIAKKFKGDTNEILIFNELASADDITVGRELVIPNVDLSVPKPSPRRRVRGGGPYLAGYFMRPINGGRKSQGLHGYNAVDLAISCGTPLFASASGSVVIARKRGWNGGYGHYVVIEHPNGTQTVYGHMRGVSVRPGWYVTKGQQIGTVGTTGRSTGCHVHFEVRGARNPF